MAEHQHAHTIGGNHMPENTTPPEVNQNAVSNPLASNLNITLSVPDTIEIKMVDASALSDYEIWFFIASLLFGVVTGFAVPFIQSIEIKTDCLLGVNALIFLLLFIIALAMAIRKRNQLKKKSRTVDLKVSQ
jgi:hypothetical protein